MEEKNNRNYGKNYYYPNSKNNDGGLIIRKGPWKPEEDQVLLDHVSQYGPRDWSSIRSKGLLLRTGKSCRLRWVNKLRPDLKSGCKFTAEEERVVIELQSQIGNKWATIATHLSGRTDNDVKNFWSSRQKRLARLFHSQPPPTKRLKSSSSSSSSTTTNAISSRKSTVPKKSFSEGETSSKPQSSSTMQMITFPETTIADANNAVRLGPVPPIEYPIDELIFPLIPLPPETQELIDRLDPGFLPTFGYTDEPVFADDGSHLLSCCGCGTRDLSVIKGGIDNSVTPDSFFDDFPSDMFDQIEPLPSPSSW